MIITSSRRVAIQNNSDVQQVFVPGCVVEPSVSTTKPTSVPPGSWLVIPARTRIHQVPDGCWILTSLEYLAALKAGVIVTEPDPPVPAPVKEEAKSRAAK
jgi:hypothetical protein